MDISEHGLFKQMNGSRPRKQDKIAVSVIGINSASLKRMFKVVEYSEALLEFS